MRLLQREETTTPAPTTTRDGAETLSPRTTVAPPAAAAPAAARRPSRFVPSAHGPVSVWMLDEDDCPAWDAFVSSEPDGGLYHTLAWREALACELQGAPLSLMALRGEDFVGVLPLWLVEDSAGRRLESLPGTPAAGLLTSDAGARTALLDRAAEYARRNDVVDCRQRRFASPAPDEPLRAGWARIPAAALRAHACSENDPWFPGKGAADPQQHTLLHGVQLHCPGVDAMLRRLAAAGGHPGHLSTRDGCGRPNGTVVWVRYRQAAHVLGYRTNTVGDRRHVLRQLSDALAARPVEWVDLPLPDQPDPWLCELLSAPGARVSVERPLVD